MKALVTQIVEDALSAAIASGELPLQEVPSADIERPRDATHGDWATAVALRSAKLAGMSPRAIADIVVSHLSDHPDIDAVEIAGPGFINLRLSVKALTRIITEVRELRASFGKAEPKAEYIQVEFVSANPVGPMHVGHGRWAALGDALCLVLEHAGYRVQREFYLNDEGNQMNVFADSVAERYLELCGESFDEDLIGYKGTYIKDIAAQIFEAEERQWVEVSASERRSYFRQRSYDQVLSHVKSVLERFGVAFDQWFSEHSMHVPDDEGKTEIQKSIDGLAAKGHIYEEEGALWFKSEELGDDKNRVLLKGDGSATYFAADIAYHENKFMRGFDKVINLWGADHHGYIKRMEAAVAALGHAGQLEILLGQLVTLYRDGQLVRMSKRTGEMVTFEELIDEVGVDAARYHLVRISSDQPLAFDIDQAKDQSSNNPVFYVQYAHARICSILRKAGNKSGEDVADIDALAAAVIGESIDLSLLSHEAELALMRKISEFSEVVERAARDRAPFRLTHYAEELASLYHQFYQQCQVLGDDEALSNARLSLVDAVRHTLANTLMLIGISAPNKM
ncbi:MAG: arginine--tRNA ligase [Coriobacteriia bacterium]|nr:arginine--tRNA ligase [Coriobacteriia bacterium]